MAGHGMRGGGAKRILWITAKTGWGNRISRNSPSPMTCVIGALWPGYLGRSHEFRGAFHEGMPFVRIKRRLMGKVNFGFGFLGFLSLPLSRHRPFACPVCVAARKPRFWPSIHSRHRRIGTAICIVANRTAHRAPSDTIPPAFAFRFRHMSLQPSRFAQPLRRHQPLAEGVRAGFRHGSPKRRRP